MKINDCYRCGNKMREHFVHEVVDCVLRNNKLEHPYMVLKCTKCPARSMSFFSHDIDEMRYDVINHWNKCAKEYRKYMPRVNWSSVRLSLR